MTKVAFHCNQLTLRGVEVSTFDYAHFNEVLLGNFSIILTPAQTSNNHPLAKEKFESRFKVFYYSSIEELELILKEENVDVFYIQKAGFNDGLISRKVKSVVHVVFKFNEKHGEVYAYVSEWLSTVMTGGKSQFVPLPVYLPDYENNLRSQLAIPEGAIVFGRYGGWETFDIFFVKLLIINLIKRQTNLYFIFMNTDNFVTKGILQASKEVISSKYGKKVRVLNLILAVYIRLKGKLNMKNVVFLKGTTDMKKKVEFINTCDAMLHARKQGESFGLACAEFSIKNKPVITYKLSDEKAHIDMLGDKGIYYSNYRSLKNIIINFRPNKEKNWDAYSSKYNPNAVMQKFKSVFLD